MNKPNLAERYRRWKNADGPGPKAVGEDVWAFLSAAPLGASASAAWTANDHNFDAQLRRRLGASYRGFTGQGYANRYGGGFVHRPSGKVPTTYVLHHTAGAANGTGAGIWRYHVQTRGWDTDGYHLLISPDGTVEMMIPPSLMSYGAAQFNPTTIHVCVHGDYTQIAPDPRALATVYQVFLTLDQCYGDHAWRGHRELMSTACPGALLAHFQKMRGASYGAASPPRASYP